MKHIIFWCQVITYPSQFSEDNNNIKTTLLETDAHLLAQNRTVLKSILGTNDSIFNP